MHLNGLLLEVQDGTRLAPIRVYKDDMTMQASIITTAPCSCLLLAKLNENLKWAGMKVKPTKGRIVSISKDKLLEEK